MINILCLDGGGVRGYMSARILAAIEVSLQKPLVNTFTYFSGVSAGSILSFGLLRGYSAQEVVKMFRELAPNIFYSPLAYRLKSGGGLFDSIYPDTYIEAELSRVFGTWSAPEVPRDFLVTSYDITRNTPLYFSRNTTSLSVAEIVRSSTAAPVYFPPKKLIIDGVEILAVDGGVVNNNPCEIALVHALHQYGSDSTFNILSVGTGMYDGKGVFKKPPSGLISWSTNIIDTMFNANTANSMESTRLLKDSLLRRIRGVERFDRIEWSLDQDIRLDDATSFDVMDRIIDGWLAQNQAVIDEIASYYK